MKIKFKRLHKDAVIPQYMTAGAAGFDLYTSTAATIAPFSTALIHTELQCEIPFGYEMQIRPRSGMSMDYPNYIANSPGTIDSDYRGEILIMVQNNTDNYMHIKKWDRVAQGVVAKVECAEIVETDELSSTERGTGGTGSTGR